MKEQIISLLESGTSSYDILYKIKVQPTQQALDMTEKLIEAYHFDEYLEDFIFNIQNA